MQLVTGLSILASGYISLPCGLSAYHWQIIVYLAWFSSVTHLSGLALVRRHLANRFYQLWARSTLMLLLLALLLVALFPTGFFNWSESDPVVYNSTQIAHPAVCYLDSSIGRRLWDELYRDPFIDSPRYSWRAQHLETTAAFQAMVFSMILLIFGVVARSIKIMKPLSYTISFHIRRPLSLFFRRKLDHLRRHSTLLASSGKGFRAGIGWTIFYIALTPFLASRLLLDLYASGLAEVRVSSSLLSLLRPRVC